MTTDMGTRSLTIVKDGKDTVLTMYRQYDGDPEGLGEEIVSFLQDSTIVNGLGGDKGRVHNGMGCLAASLVAHLKEGPGNVYLYPEGSNDVGEEYVYTITDGGDGLPLVECKETYGDGKTIIPASNPTDFLQAIKDLPEES